MASIFDAAGVPRSQLAGQLIEQHTAELGVQLSILLGWHRAPLVTVFSPDLAGALIATPMSGDVPRVLLHLAAIPTEHGLCTFKPVVGGFECPFGRNCDSCEHFVITGADYGYWKRQEERWAAMAEGAPDGTARDYIYETFERSSQALAGLEKALLALGLLDRAKELDLRSPHQDFFNPIWTQGWRAGDLVEIGGGEKTTPGPPRSLEVSDDGAARATS